MGEKKVFGFENPENQVSERMRKVKSTGTSIEKKMKEILEDLKIKFEIQPKIDGKPDFKIKKTNLLIFCDSAFWHGKRKNDTSGKTFYKNKAFWVKKLNENKNRDKKTNRRLRNQGWAVYRFWDEDIINKPNKVKTKLIRALEGKN